MALPISRARFLRKMYPLTVPSGFSYVNRLSPHIVRCRWPSASSTPGWQHCRPQRSEEWPTERPSLLTLELPERVHPAATWCHALRARGRRNRCKQCGGSCFCKHAGASSMIAMASASTRKGGSATTAKPVAAPASGRMGGTTNISCVAAIAPA